MGICLGLNLEFSRHHNMSFQQAVEEPARIGYEYDEEDFLLSKYSLKITDADPGKQIIDEVFKAAGEFSPNYSLAILPSCQAAAPVVSFFTSSSISNIFG